MAVNAGYQQYYQTRVAFNTYVVFISIANFRTTITVYTKKTESIHFQNAMTTKQEETSITSKARYDSDYTDR